MMCGLMRPSFRSFAVVALSAAVTVLSGCEGNPTFPEPDDVTQTYEVFTGTLEPNGRYERLLSIGASTNFQMTLAGTTVGTPPQNVSPVLGLEIGFYDGEKCSPFEEAETAAKFAPALHRYLAAGSYCVALADKRGMTEPVNFVLRLDGPPLMRTIGEPGTETFTSTITQGGRVSRTFNATRAGTASVSVTNITPSNVPVGLAIGIHGADNPSCAPAVTTITTPGGPGITVPVSPGFYCAVIYDLGNFVGDQSFTLSITNP